MIMRTMGAPDRDVAEPLATPFSLPFPCVWHPRQSRSRSGLSDSDFVEVAASAAIFCKACRRMSLDALRFISTHFAVGTLGGIYLYIVANVDS